MSQYPTNNISQYKPNNINNSKIDNNINNNIQVEELKKQLNDEKNKNELLIQENNYLKQIINKYNMDINKIEELKNKIKLLQNDLNKKNNEIQQLLAKNNNIKDNDDITPMKPDEKIIGINFVSKGNQDIGNYNLICKNSDLFIILEERLNEDFPKFKEYETYFEVNGKRIKRFKTLEQNNIKNDDIINIFTLNS